MLIFQVSSLQKEGNKWRAKRTNDCRRENISAILFFFYLAYLGDVWTVALENTNGRYMGKKWGDRRVEKMERLQDCQWTEVPLGKGRAKVYGTEGAPPKKNMLLQTDAGPVLLSPSPLHYVMRVIYCIISQGLPNALLHYSALFKISQGQAQDRHCFKVRPH